MQAANVLPEGIIHPIPRRRLYGVVAGHLIGLGAVLTVFRVPLYLTFAVFLLGIGISVLASRGLPFNDRRSLTKRELFALIGGMAAVLSALFILGEIFGEETVKNWPLHPLAYILGWSQIFHSFRHLRSIMSSAVP